MSERSRSSPGAERVMGERLQKILATAGVCSRRDAKQLIRDGVVKVDGCVVTDTGFRVDSQDAVITVRGKRVRTPRMMYVMMNKPKGYVTTLSDPQRRRTVAELLPRTPERLKPVGRLDFASEGLLLFTNDGDLIQRLTHPSFGVWKVYRVEVFGSLPEKSIARLERGVVIEGRRTAPARVRVFSHDPKKGRTTVEVSVHEGRKHQVRNMLAAVGATVVSLRRTKVGPLTLRGLGPGQCRALTREEVARLKQATENAPRRPAGNR